MNTRSFALTSANVGYVVLRQSRSTADLPQAYVQRLDGSTWSTLGEPLAPELGQPVSASSLAFDAAERPVVHLEQSDGSVTNCYVFRANRR